MRHLRKLALLAPLGFVAALAGAVAAFCGGPEPIPLTAVSRGALAGDVFYTVADGKLTAVDLKKHDATVMHECYALYPKLRPFVDAADGKACVASDDRVLLIDLDGGKVLHAAKYTGEVNGLGLAGDDRVFVLGRTDIVVLDVARGETVCSIPILKDEPNRRARAAAFSCYAKAGKLLYVADSADLRIAVIDLDAGKVVDEMGNGYEWFTGMQIVGDRLFVRAINLSYGINNPLLGYFDLKTKKYTALKHPAEDKLEHVAEAAFPDATLVAGPNGGVCLSWKGKVYQYDADGKQVGETDIDPDDQGRLVGSWNRWALTAGKDALHLTRLPRATAAKSD